MKTLAWAIFLVAIVGLDAANMLAKHSNTYAGQGIAVVLFIVGLGGFFISCAIGK